MPTILMVRHAQASFGASDYDVLSALGLTQVDALAADLQRRGVRIDRVLSGSLARQQDTARPIAMAIGCKSTVDPRWDEYDTNDIFIHHSTSPARQDRPPGSGAPAVTSQVFQEALDEALRAWIAAGADGPASESWTAFAGRIAAALAAAVDGLGSGETALVSTSGGVVAATCVALLGLAPSAFVAFNRVTVNTGISKIVHGRSGTTLVSFNDHSHLEQDGRSLLSYR